MVADAARLVDQSGGTVDEPGVVEAKAIGESGTGKVLEQGERDGLVERHRGNLQPSVPPGPLSRL